MSQGPLNRLPSGHSNTKNKLMMIKVDVRGAHMMNQSPKIHKASR